MFSDKWNRRFMELAFMVASWSKDPSTKTGAVVVGPDREIRATGYNGLVRGVDDNIPERMERPTKYDFFEHADKCRSGIYADLLCRGVHRYPLAKKLLGMFHANHRDIVGNIDLKFLLKNVRHIFV